MVFYFVFGFGFKDFVMLEGSSRLEVYRVVILRDFLEDFLEKVMFGLSFIG